MAKREVEIKKSLGRRAGEAFVNGYLKKAGGAHELNRLRRAFGAAPISGPKPSSSTYKGSVDEDELLALMRDHADLNGPDERLSSPAFNSAVHYAWIAVHGRALNDFERKAMVEMLSEVRRYGTRDRELDLVDELLEEHQDLITENDPDCHEVTQHVEFEIGRRLIRSVARSAQTRLKVEAHTLWERKYGGEHE